MKRQTLGVAVVMGIILAASVGAQQRAPAGKRELRASRIEQWRDSRQQAHRADQGRVLHDVAYGADPLQKMDIYLPEHPRNAPIVMMVHGGGWRRGDKSTDGVVEAKAARWVPKGAIVVSVNYRLLPTPLSQQAEDVASAARYLQQHAGQWGGNGKKVILMGHSAGAHLVALVGANPKRWGIAPVLGTVSLDSAALNVPETMTSSHFDLHDDAFGADPATWVGLSPYHALVADGGPMLLVCSQPRATSCDQSNELAAKANAMGRPAQMLPEDKSHGQINHELGQPGEYTRQVEAFLGQLDPVFR